MTLCVTGPMAAGKNAVASLLENLGFVAIDADEVAHIAVQNSAQRIYSEFGKLAESRGLPLIGADGYINRSNLGALIFEDEALLRRQEEIVHPEINNIIERFIAENVANGRNSVINATVLYKIPAMCLVDAIIFVVACKSVRLDRALKRNRLSAKQILARFRTQRGLLKAYKATGKQIFTLRNSASFAELESGLQRVLHELGQTHGALNCSETGQML